MCKSYAYHQQKLVLIFTSMRRFAESLRKKGFQVHYIPLESKKSDGSYFDILQSELKKLGVKEIRVDELADRGFMNDMKRWAKTSGIKIHEKPSESFLTPSALYSEILGERRPFMKAFYEWQRKRLNILTDINGEPTGGKWSFDTENRKKLPKKFQAPSIPVIKRNKIVEEVIQLIEREFPKNPGKAADFWLPTDHQEALVWLDDFLESRLNGFGPYEDAISAGNVAGEDILYHSALSPLMNIGLIPAKLILERTLRYASKNKTPIASLEGFIRQIIGWREFIKGIDSIYGERQTKENFFNHKRKLKSCWYDGTTGLPPVDDAIRKALRRGYNHHIERLMILSNVMLLSEVEPTEVHKWFMEMYVDSSEWVMGPNVYGMGQFSDGGIFATKPYICGSNYILKMSDYSRGPWCETWDALYWNFVDRHLDFFKKNHRISMAAHLVAKMPAAKRAKYREHADRFRDETTK